LIDAKRVGIDARMYDIDYLLANSPFKLYNPKEYHDWSRYRVYSILQMPSHPSYESMYQEVKKFMPNILNKEVQMEKMKRGEADPHMAQVM
jgi:hypothetical protein